MKNKFFAAAGALVLIAGVSVYAQNVKTGGQAAQRAVRQQQAIMQPYVNRPPEDYYIPKKPVIKIAGQSTLLDANLGDNVVLTLDANHTTGYSWQIAKPIDTDTLEFVETKYIPTETGLIGEGGTEIWVFRALKKGETEVAFKYVRPWEKDAAPAREALFTIVIK